MTPSFRRLFDRLPSEVRARAVAAFRRFQANPAHRGLAFKLVGPARDIWSARVSDDYRVVGYRQGDATWWFWIGKHAEYEKLLERL